MAPGAGTAREGRIQQGENNGIPDGPHRVVTSGRFDGDWGHRSGREWRFVAWRDSTGYCFRFEISESSQDEQSVSCSLGSMSQERV